MHLWARHRELPACCTCWEGSGTFTWLGWWCKLTCDPGCALGVLLGGTLTQAPACIGVCVSPGNLSWLLAQGGCGPCGHETLMTPGLWPSGPSRVLACMVARPQRRVRVLLRCVLRLQCLTHPCCTACCLLSACFGRLLPSACAACCPLSRRRCNKDNPAGGGGDK